MQPLSESSARADTPDHRPRARLRRYRDTVRFGADAAGRPAVIYRAARARPARRLFAHSSVAARIAAAIGHE